MRCNPSPWRRQAERGRNQKEAAHGAKLKLDASLFPISSVKR